MCVCDCVSVYVCVTVSVCVFYLCLKELDESGEVVLILAAVSFQITLNNLVASLAHFSLLTVGGSVEQGRKKEGGGIKVQMYKYKCRKPVKKCKRGTKGEWGGVTKEG